MKKQTPFARAASWSAMLTLPFTLILLTLHLMNAAAAPAAHEYNFLDPDFDSDGRVLIPISGTNQIARDTAIQPDGKIIIAGYDKWNTSDYDAILARVNPDGSPDAAFGAGGIVTTALTTDNDAIYAIDLQPDGKIAAAGRTTEGGDAIALLMRYNAGGSLDASFGSGGVVTTSFRPDGSWFLSVTALDNGRILAGGTVNGSPGAFLLARYQANGAPDTAWGNNGVVTTTIPGGDAASWDMALQTDGKILLAGNVRPSGGDGDFALIRYNPDGSLDAGFGSGGIVTQTLGSNDYAYGVLVQSDGKIVLSGRSGTSSTVGGAGPVQCRRQLRQQLWLCRQPELRHDNGDRLCFHQF